jgi:hypothetical protein
MCAWQAADAAVATEPTFKLGACACMVLHGCLLAAWLAVCADAVTAHVWEWLGLAPTARSKMPMFSAACQ